VERDQRLRASRDPDELHLEAIGIVGVHDSAQIPLAETVLGKVAVEDNCFERLELHWLTRSSGGAQYRLLRLPVGRDSGRHQGETGQL